MRKKQDKRLGQLVLELEPPKQQAPFVKDPTGVVEALADLLLSAARTDPRVTTGGRDER